MASPLLLRLMLRNIRLFALDPMTLVLLIGLPALYLVFFGFGFQAVVSPSGTGAGGYLSFLTPGIMAFQSVIAGTVAGSLLWSDKRSGMLAQLMVGPFTRLQYLLGIMFTSVIFGLVGALVMLAGAYLLLGSLSTTLPGAAVMFGVIAVGSVFFGSLMLLASAFVGSPSTYNSIQALIIFVANFASTVFYPFRDGLPLAMRILFVANPLTYVANVVRDGYVGALSPADGYQVALLFAETVLILALAAKAYKRSGVSFV